ncbi:reverse transcriptase domain-containing protein [Ralstonia pseudosolanacearum]|uniref:reverse transcriptase domain-containing protein n=1 Tax=Ralstonia pseudosolanacearum TaxID=1310165 RepID=UPI0026747D19|nr:reverse transcriptase domain-containing protein [Ralstonia pseudosolanacearum]MDO3517739.1 reverse transcriptase domain-containing protein [Ralstonia pseudosolanacearum]MDO3541024.1 reverse transcriptase domain-containing protein [Ralstonia pseudosolanacearum]
MKPIKATFIVDIQSEPVDDETLFKTLFSQAELERAFKEKFATTTGKGVDRLNGFQFAHRAAGELTVASAKILAAQFRFSPFLEVLRPKARDKLPRLIGIPTVRDRVVLHQLNKYVAALYPERVPRNVASTYVRELADDLRARPLGKTWVCSTDIKMFYDSIKQARLLSLLAKRIKCDAAIKLVGHAITTPTVPRNTRRSRHKDYAPSGVPQGLAISNILASIYMQDVDESMKGLGVAYYRYVDDVLMYGEHDAVHIAYKSLRTRLTYRGLTLHPLGSGKTQIEPLEKPFGYLGYTFRMPVISVRPSTTERFLHSVAAKFSDFVHNKTKRLEKFKYLNEERLKEIFLHELNERITGAISKKQRYGWIAYFNQISDLSLLHRLDAAVEGMFKRIKEFGHEAPPGLKKLRRAYYEMKFNPQGGYVRDYDLIATFPEMLKFLVERGRVDPDVALTDVEIKEKYEKYVNHVLAAMHADEGAVYG